MLVPVAMMLDFSIQQGYRSNPYVLSQIICLDVNPQVLQRIPYSPEHSRPTQQSHQEAIACILNTGIPIPSPHGDLDIYPIPDSGY